MSWNKWCSGWDYTYPPVTYVWLPVLLDFPIGQKGWLRLEENLSNDDGNDGKHSVSVGYELGTSYMC